MRIRSSPLLAVLLLAVLLPAAAEAGRHRPDAFIGYFHAEGSKYDGFQFSGSWPILPKRDLSLIVTFGRYWGEEDEKDTDHTLAPNLIGLRWTFHAKPGDEKKSNGRLKKELLPFVQLLGGYLDDMKKVGDPANENLKEVRTHALAVVGVGIQPAMRKRRDEHDEPRLRFRIQMDFFYRDKKSFTGVAEPAGGFGVAFSGGLVYQFGEVGKHKD
jgi:hypothetical protein